jgi:hypothetical protein
MKTILILGSSGQASLSAIKCLRLANLMNPKYKIITEDIDPLLPGAYVGDIGYLLEKEDDKWVKGINKIISEEKVDLVIPCHDIPIDIISARQEEIKAPVLIAEKEKIEGMDETMIDKDTMKILKKYVKEQIELCENNKRNFEALAVIYLYFTQQNQKKRVRRLPPSEKDRQAKNVIMRRIKQKKS